MHVDIFIITNNIIKTSNEISLQWIIGGRIHDKIIYDLRVDDFIGVLAKDEFAELSGENETVSTQDFKALIVNRNLLGVVVRVTLGSGRDKRELKKRQRGHRYFKVFFKCCRCWGLPQRLTATTVA